MKKIYSIMLALFATLCVGTAYAEDPITLTINVDNPNAIELKMTEGNGEKTLPLVAGDNVITVPYAPEYYSYEILKVNINSGYLVDSLTVSPEEAPTWEDYTRWGGGYELSTDADCAGAVYSFHTTNLNLLRQDTVVVIIDNPSKVKVMYYGSGQIDITDDTTIVAYCSDPDETRLQDLPLTVRAMNPYQGDLIYKVFLNSDEVTKVSEYGDDYYPFNTLAKNDTIRVLTEAPADLVVPAILNLDEVAKEALDSVMVNGVKVALKDTLLVPWGKKIELAFNVDDYKVTANNTPLNNYSNPYSATVTDTTIIKVTAEKYVKYDVTVILHDYTCFQYLYVDNYIYLEKDTTILTMSSKSPRVTVYAADECLLDSIKWNGSVQSGATITCDAEGTLEVWAHKIVRNEKFMLYVERDSMSSMSMSSTHRHYFIDYYNPLTTDYTEFAFSVADDNPISASFRAKSGKKVVCYQNDTIVTPNWDGYKLTLANNDVVKIFADTAKVYTVTLNKGEKAIVKGVTKDRVWALNADTTSFTVLQGTEVTVTVPTNMVLTGGDDELTGENGVYTITVNSDTTINITATDATNCAEANAAAKGTHAVLGEFVVAYVNGAYTYIQDETGSALIFKYGFGLNAGDVVKGFEGDVDIYNSLPELVPSVKLEDLTVTAGEVPAPAVHTETLTIEDVNKYIKLEGVTAVGTFTSDNKTTIKGEWNGEPLNMYNQFKIAQEFKEGVTYDVVCAVSVYKTTLQVNFISAEALSTNVENAVTSNKAEKFVRDGQLIIRMNGVEYNVLGAKLQ